MRSPSEVIIRPVVTERSTLMADEHNVYAFIVVRNANKIEIRRAVEDLFDVRVAAVRTMNYRGKWRRVGRSTGRRAAYKKAIVQLAEGERIDVYEGV
ncbi:MAG: 50S ribosomal protein L23 [Longimicrobiales bacterium]